MKCCIYVRFINEHQYLPYFVEHYLNLGFDKIIILYYDDKVTKYELPNYFVDRVEIVYVKNLGHRLLNRFKDHIPSHYDWVLIIDNDEYLMLHQEYKDIKDFVQKNEDKCEAKFHLIQFSWAWMHCFAPSNPIGFSQLIQKYRKFIGVKERKSKDVWVKTMVRIPYLNTLFKHSSTLSNTNTISIFVNGEHIEFENPLIQNDDLLEDQLLYTHYLVNDSTYKDAILLHIQSRCLEEVINKTSSRHPTHNQAKSILNKRALMDNLKKFANSKKNNLFENVVKNIGYGIQFPMDCLSMMEIDNKYFSNYKTYQSYYNFCEGIPFLKNKNYSKKGVEKVREIVDILFTEREDNVSSD